MSSHEFKNVASSVDQSQHSANEIANQPGIGYYMKNASRIHALA